MSAPAGFSLGIYVFKEVEIVDFAAPYGVFSVARRLDPSLDAGQERNAVAPFSNARLRSGSLGVFATTTMAVRGAASRSRRSMSKSLAPRGTAETKMARTPRPAATREGTSDSSPTWSAE